jgi:hypothetical protein
MTRRLLLALTVLIPTFAQAQTRTTVSAYVGSDPGVPGDPLLVGGTFAREGGFFVTRFGAAFDVSDPAGAVPPELAAPELSGIWNADADALVYLGGPRGNATLIPYGLVGVGMRGVRHDGRLGGAANYSYGGGFRAPLGAGFAFEGEVRHREIFAEVRTGPERVLSSGLEYRFGMSLGFGGRAAHGGTRLVPAPTPPRPLNLPAGARVTRADAHVIASNTLSTAERYIGVRYLWGGNTPQTGFDCSGFIRYVYDLNGIQVPRVSQDQARFGSPVPLEISAFQPGDILAFATSGREVDHTAIYAGNGLIIHSSSSGKGVRYDDLYSERGQWFVRHMVAARRIIEGQIYLGDD